MLKIRLDGTSVLAGLLLCLMGVSSAAEKPLISLGSEATKVTESSADFDRYDLLLGGIHYVVRSGLHVGEGYTPDATKSVAGRITKRVHDYSTGDSALSILSHMKERFHKEGFEILFQCEAQECGDVAGWRLFMSDAIEGDIKSQHYLVARHQNKQGNDWYVAFYVNEFTDIPRSVIHTIDISSTAHGSVVINKDALSSKTFSDKLEPLAIVTFNSGSADISELDRQILTNLSKKLMNHSGVELEVAGHTDAVGEIELNNELSLQRAEEVKSLLVNGGIESHRLQTTGYGESRLLEAHHSGAQANRRVEILAIASVASTNHLQASPEDFTGASAEPF